MLTEVIVFVTTALIFGAAIIPFLVLNKQKIRPEIVSPETAQRHLALIYLIRGGELLVAVPIFAVIALIFLGFFFSLNPFQRQSGASEAYSIIMLITILLTAAWIIVKSIHRYRTFGRGPFENFLQVNANSVGNFAFIFAAFAAHDAYQLMPPWKPQPHLPLLMHFLNREFLWIAVFFLGRSCVITILKRVLELNPKTPPRNPEPPDQSDSGPHVPFDPYNLPNNRPLRPLPGGL